ncbi:PilW family protein [Vibrio renipiscarius]|uniref:PilW family protein n=1 Tax=Vibrio renipiscarius TaxID=1461322 RepID=UPI00069C98A9|nr:prepilin-type N-terminal cleavage/methylation domain-containing protein [Vibrio renipiscarius]
MNQRIQTSMSAGNKGFTLIEMVVSMVIIGIISVGLINYGVISSTLYMGTQYRLSALEEARFLLTRFSRELPNTVPMSPRILGQGECIEYIPMLYVGEFLPDQLDLSARHSGTELPLAHPIRRSLLAQCFVDPAQPCLVSIYPRKSEELYLGANVSNQIFTLTSVGSQSLTVAESLLRRPLTPSNRLFVYQPFARQMCATAAQIRYYPNYPINVAGRGVLNGAAWIPFAQGVESNQPIFSLGFNGTYSSTVSMKFSLKVNQGTEKVEFMQNAQILNGQ